jgi:Rod binding domain-containing protein
MSFSSSDMSLGSIGTTAGVSSLNVADIPENIRNGNNTAKQAYSEGLAFENVLVNELTQQLANTMYGGSGTDSASSTDSSDGSSSSSSGLLSGAGAYASMIPQALGSSIMSGGGLGIAEQFAQEIDPSLNAPTSTQVTASTDATGTATGTAAGTGGTAGAGEAGI